MNRRAALMQARDTRNGARALLDGQLSALRAELDAKGIRERLTDEAIDKAADVIEQTVEVAKANKAVIAGTIAALALWFLRNPLLTLARKALGQDEAHMEDNTDD